MSEKPTPEQVPAAMLEQLRRLLTDIAREKKTGVYGFEFKATCGVVNWNSVLTKTENRTFAD